MMLTNIATAISAPVGYAIMSVLALACVGMTIAIVRALCDR